MLQRASCAVVQLLGELADGEETEEEGEDGDGGSEGEEGDSEDAQGGKGSEENVGNEPQPLRDPKRARR